MDLAIPVGVVLSIGLVLLGQRMEGGHWQSLIQETAAIIVLGGCLGAVIVQFTFAQFAAGLKVVAGMIKGRPDHSLHYLEQIIEFSNVVRKQGLLALEKSVKEVHDPFFRKGLQLLMDGTEPRVLREIMETEFAFGEEHAEIGPKVLDAFGGYAPTYGIIGAVLGLIHVMQNLDDPSKIGGGIAVAFVATVYGLVAANLICLPLANKLKMGNKLHGISQQLLIEGLMSMSSGENPRLTEEKLSAFLSESQKKAWAAKAKKK